MSIYKFTAIDIQGQERNLEEFKGKVVLLVNTASKCGFTSQFEGLETLYKDLNDKGLVILGFPCNQFAKQEKGSDAEIAGFCMKNYGVSFPMFSKIEVNGDNAHPLFQYVKEQAPGLLGSQGIKWNFTKFLIDQNGHVSQRFAPKDKPESLRKHIEALLS